MLDLDTLSKLRFGMSEVPKIGGQRGAYEEKWSQWFLERSFFRDFVYRNPRGKKKGEELTDAVVLFDDVMIMVQVRSSASSRSDVTRLGWPAQAEVRGAHGAGSRTAGSVFVSEPPLPHQSCGLVRGRCVRAAQLARLRRHVS